MWQSSGPTIVITDREVSFLQRLDIVPVRGPGAGPLSTRQLPVRCAGGILIRVAVLADVQSDGKNWQRALAGLCCNHTGPPICRLGVVAAAALRGHRLWLFNSATCHLCGAQGFQSLPSHSVVLQTDHYILPI